MTSRREFVQGSLAGTGMLLAAEMAAAQSESGKRRYVDKLTDDAGKYAIAPLPYTYDALEPVIDAKTVEFHYNFHHKPAVVAANRVEEGLAKARDTGDYGQVKALEKELAFQLSSH